jgi:hemolysin activation/secretion protein
MIKKRIKSRMVVCFFPLFLSPVIAVAAIPGPVDVPSTVNPSIVGQQVQPKQIHTPQALQPISHPEEKKTSPLGAQATKIKFKLKQIILQDNHVYSEAKLRPIYQDKLDKVITVAELQDIVQGITNYYRNNGYILSRAIIPPQHVKNGVVAIRVIEGYIDQVTVVGTPKGSRSIVAAYGRRIARNRPLQLKNMERYLFLANEVPGVQAKAVLEPSKAEVGASDLALATQAKLLSAYVSYDNYGTRYIGPPQLTANIEADSIFRSGDATRMTYVTTSQGNELKYKDVSYQMPLGTDGMTFTLDGNQAMTNPLFTLEPLQVFGDAINYSGTLRYPWIRSRSQNLTVEAALNYLNSRTTEFQGLFVLYSDRVRSLRFGGTYDFADKYMGSNVFNANIIRGIPILKGTTNDQSFETSRFGATTVYTRVTAQFTRLQQIYGRFSGYGLLKGQYSFQPLLASEQFGYGGSQLGRGYDPAEIIGDRGAAGSVELRMNMYPERFYVQTLQFYLFYDAGVVWNLRNVQGTPTKQDATSTGLGVRFYMNKYIAGNFMFTQPLSKKVAALAQIGNGSLPRLFFSISASA